MGKIQGTAAEDEITIGPPKLEIHDIRSRIATLKQWRDPPPRHAGGIRERIGTLALTRVHIATQVSLPVGFRVDGSAREFLSAHDRT